MAHQPRVMPRQGFYIWLPSDVMCKDDPTKIRCSGAGEIVFTNGQRSIKQGGFHRYWRPSDFNDAGPQNIPSVNDWALLQWNCVPGLKDLADNYVYAETFEEAVHIYNTAPHKQSISAV
jgi:hypothetical protein